MNSQFSDSTIKAILQVIFPKLGENLLSDLSIGAAEVLTTLNNIATNETSATCSSSEPTPVCIF